MDIVTNEKSQQIFLIEWKEGQDFQYSAEFTVHEISTWDSTGQYIDYEQYLKGYIKWDGCSHIWFGDGSEDNNGYMHLCGESYFVKHAQIILYIWQVCAKKIIKWDPC